MTLAIGHKQDDVVILDAVRERKPPFSPEDVVAEFAALLKTYRRHYQLPATGMQVRGQLNDLRKHGITL